MKKYLVLILLLLPIYTFALNGSFDLNKTSLSMEVGKTASFTVTAKNATGKVAFSTNNSSICTVNKDSVWLDKDAVTVTVKGVTSGNCTITVNINGGSYDETPIITTKTINVKVNNAKSSVNTLSELKVDGYLVDGFNATKTSYDLNNNSGTSINITAIATDVNAKISGTGNKKLSFGKNTFKIVVTAENSSQKTYTITVTKPDSRSNNNYLSALTIDKGTITFDKNTTNYTVKLAHEIEEITINATAIDNKASIKGTGTKKLVDYANEFNIVVTAENGSQKTYVIKVIRQDEVGNYGKLNCDNTIKKISIKDQNINFDDAVKDYNLLVESNVEELVFDIETNDPNATVRVLNNELKDGLNNVIVQIVAEDGSINEYRFNVYRLVDEPEAHHIEEPVVEEKDDKINIWMIISIIEFVLLIICIIVIIMFLKKKNKSDNNTNNQNTTLTSNTINPVGNQLNYINGKPVNPINAQINSINGQIVNPLNNQNIDTVNNNEVSK